MAGVLGKTCKFAVDDGTGGAYVVLADVLQTGSPSNQTDQLNITTINTSGNRKVFMAGLVEGQEVSGESLWTASENKRLLNLQNITHNWRVSYPLDGALATPQTITFPAFLTSVETEIAPDKELRIKWKLKVAGDSTIVDPT